MIVREAIPKDCNTLADIHLQSFNDFFLSSLGQRFLKTFYKACIKNPGAIAVVCNTSEGVAMGFAVVSLKSKGFYKNILARNLFAFSMEAIVLVFSRPRALLRLALNLSKSGKNAIDAAELLSIASLPEYSGRGVGKLLIETIENNLKDHQCRSLTLTTDYYDNDKVINFYRSRGFEIDIDFVTYPQRRMYRMIKYLD
ncbi:MAG: GNAT family N-acetyltransferase [Bacteroidales bacterium]|jgi:ribosomal protein S18 acetylase RimI-like enzyme|nr:GNAT family N-acetyltransferase [Bacteroidales bacterium]